MKNLFASALALLLTHSASAAALNYTCTDSTNPSDPYQYTLSIDGKTATFAMVGGAAGEYDLEKKCEVSRFEKDGLTCFNMGPTEDRDDVIGISGNLVAGLKSATETGILQERSGMAGDSFIPVYVCKIAAK